MKASEYRKLAGEIRGCRVSIREKLEDTYILFSTEKSKHQFECRGRTHLGHRIVVHSIDYMGGPQFRHARFCITSIP